MADRVLFNNQVQRGMVADRLVAELNERGVTFTEAGCSVSPPKAAQLGLTADQTRILEVARAVFHGTGRLTFAEVLFQSPPEHLRMLGSLLTALADGPAGVPLWLAGQRLESARRINRERPR